MRTTRERTPPPAGARLSEAAATPVLPCRGDYKQAPTPSRGGAGPENRAGDSTEPALLPLRREDTDQAERPVAAET